MTDSRKTPHVRPTMTVTSTKISVGVMIVAATVAFGLALIGLISYLTR